ncbi:ribonuclease HII [Vagococcus acidifermentans]|uniref:Ribonuclease HII n=1 Tax=Vagococcus acidifermentans TaxID=564710 RepID=A0A430AXZ7_9ENTE|nr:ribonuclease HII [Vagococcus acidifermentans]RSU12950.1 ribonuclease HII [Vagococcus acidifermentans]
MKQQSIKEIKEKLSTVASLDDPFLSDLAADTRKGVLTAVQQTRKRLKKAADLRAHFEEMLSFERELKERGYQCVAGIDEVGRGPLAGPVVAAAVVLPDDFTLYEVNDSKQLSAAKREALYDVILEQAACVGIGVMTERIIDEVNIYEATKLAMIDAVNQLSCRPDFLLLDAMTLNLPIHQQSLIKGDAKSASIACASIVAKVTRDRMMAEFDKQYPGYGFAKNAGYGTKEHLAGLAAQGVTPIHRRSFAPVKDMV